MHAKVDTVKFRGLARDSTVDCETTRPLFLLLLVTYSGGSFFWCVRTYSNPAPQLLSTPFPPLRRSALPIVFGAQP